jgi:hypothetical protein
MTAIKLSFPEVVKPFAVCSTSLDNYKCLMSSDEEVWVRNKILLCYDLYRGCVTSRKFESPSPDEVDFFNLPTVVLGSTQPLTGMSTRNLPGG